MVEKWKKKVTILWAGGAAFCCCTPGRFIFREKTKERPSETLRLSLLLLMVYKRTCSTEDRKADASAKKIVLKRKAFFSYRKKKKIASGCPLRLNSHLVNMTPSLSIKHVNTRPTTFFFFHYTQCCNL